MNANFEGDWACRCCVGSQSCGDRSGRGGSRVFRRRAASPGRRSGDKPPCCVTANVQWRTAGHDIIFSAWQTVEHIVEGSMKRLSRGLVLVALVTTPLWQAGRRYGPGTRRGFPISRIGWARSQTRRDPLCSGPTAVTFSSRIHWRISRA